MKFNLLKLYEFKNKEKYNNYNTNAKFVSRFKSSKSDNTYYPLFNEKGVSKAIKAFKAAKNKKEHIKHFAFLLNKFSPVNASKIMEQSTTQKEKLQKFIGVEKYEEYLKGKGFQYDQFKIDIEDLKYDNLWFDKRFQKYKKDFLTLLSNATDFLEDVIDEKRSLGQAEEKFKRRYINVVQQGAKLGRQPNSVSKAKVTALEYLRSEEAYNEAAKKITNFDSLSDTKRKEELRAQFSDRLHAVNEIFFVYTGMNLMQLSSVDTFKGEVSIYPRESYIFKDGDIKELTIILKKLEVDKIYATPALKREEFAVSWAGSSSALQKTAELDDEFSNANNIKDQIIKIKELIKGGKKAPKREKEPKVAARGGRRRRVRRAVSTAASTYNIRKAPKDRWIGGYQNKLKSFYEKNAATKAIAKEINTKDPGKLIDGRYGFRTHYVTIKAAENIISQLDSFLNTKPAAKPAATPAAAPAAKPAPAKPAAANERRIKQLSKLLETKLVGSELNLFNEQDTPASEAEKKKELQGLLKKLEQIKGRLTTAHNENSRPGPKSNAEVAGDDLLEFNKILSILSWNANGKINFDEVYKKIQPAVAAKEDPATEKEKVAQVARTIKGTCWFDFDPNTGGIRSGTPIEIWAAAGADFVEWYKQIVALFDDEGASPQFNYKSGAAAQGRLKGAPSKLNDNKTESISLDCLSVFMTKIADNFRRNGGAATMQLAQAKGTNDTTKIKKVSDGAKYFLKDDSYEDSIAHGLEQVLNKVIAIIPSFKEGQIQQAMKTIADKNASVEAKNAAREVIARARRNEKAVAANAQKAQTRAATKPAAAKGAAAQARSKPLTADKIAARLVAMASQESSKGVATPEAVNFGKLITNAAKPGDHTPEVINIGTMIFGNKKLASSAGNIAKVQQAIRMAKDILARKSTKPTAPAPAATKPATAQPAPAAAKPQKESLKQKREKLLNEAIFKKLVK